MSKFNFRKTLDVSVLSLSTGKIMKSCQNLAQKVLWVAPAYLYLVLLWLQTQRRMIMTKMMMFKQWGKAPWVTPWNYLKILSWEEFHKYRYLHQMRVNMRGYSVALLNLSYFTNLWMSLNHIQEVLKSLKYGTNRWLLKVYFISAAPSHCGGVSDAVSVRNTKMQLLTTANTV